MRTRLLIIPAAAVVAAAAALAGCGSSGSTQGAAAPTATVSAKRIAGVGMVLVDRSGRALYSPDQERQGHVSCTGACTAVWLPLTATAPPTPGPGVGRVGLLTRPAGQRQVTIDGRPAYTFVQDMPGTATGQGAQDTFGGRHFTWQLLSASGTPASHPAMSPTTNASHPAMSPTTNGYGGY